jgi:hypothetical protein
MKNIKNFKQFESVLAAVAKDDYSGIKLTPKGSSYWNETGAYQTEYDRLYKELVPNSGKSETLQGELIRAASRLNYEFYNNGNCNARDEDRSNPYQNYGYDSDDEYYEEEYPFIVSDFYQNFIDIIKNTINNKEIKTICDRIEDAIIEESSYNDIIKQVYSNLIDHVVFWCLTNPDGPNTATYRG